MLPHLTFRMSAASLLFMAASKPPACLVHDRKLGTLKTLPTPLRPAPIAAACFMASGFCWSFWPTWMAPLSAYAAPATPHPTRKADAILGIQREGHEEAEAAKQSVAFAREG